jgi:hypothetical protein
MSTTIEQPHATRHFHSPLIPLRADRHGGGAAVFGQVRRQRMHQRNQLIKDLRQKVANMTTTIAEMNETIAGKKCPECADPFSVERHDWAIEALNIERNKVEECKRASQRATTHLEDLEDHVEYLMEHCAAEAEHDVYAAERTPDYYTPKGCGDDCSENED